MNEWRREVPLESTLVEKRSRTQTTKIAAKEMGKIREDKKAKTAFKHI